MDEARWNNIIRVVIGSLVEMKGRNVWDGVDLRLSFVMLNPTNVASLVIGSFFDAVMKIKCQGQGSFETMRTSVSKSMIYDFLNRLICDWRNELRGPSGRPELGFHVSHCSYSKLSKVVVVDDRIYVVAKQSIGKEDIRRYGKPEDHRRKNV